MRWLWRIAGLCLALGALMWWSIGSEPSCFLKLACIEHLVNCPGLVVPATREGRIQNGIWVDRREILEFCDHDDLHCPATGAAYVLTFTVGEHPYCAVHGRLIEEYGFRARDHDPLSAPGYPQSMILTSRLLVGLGILLTAAGSVIFLLRRLREGFSGGFSGEKRPGKA